MFPVFAIECLAKPCVVTKKNRDFPGYCREEQGLIKFKRCGSIEESSLAPESTYRYGTRDQCVGPIVVKPTNTKSK